jgi:hypothetical protein
VDESRIPLADDLFQNRKTFADVASKLPRLLPILPQLRTRAGNKSIEEVLEELRSIDRKEAYWPQRQRELAAIRFYLQQAIWGSEAEMIGHAAGVSNYSTLVNNIEQFRRSDEPVILITFNYDTLIERALSLTFGDFTFKEIQDYVRRPAYKLFKLRGSVNWGYPILDDARLNVDQRPESVTNAIIDLADSLRYQSNDFAIMHQPAVLSARHAYFPAISIPVQKKSHFSCPETWLPFLEKQLEGVSNLLIIGWRGSEEHFLKMAVPVLSKNAELSISVVSNTDKSAQETHTLLQSSGLRAAHRYDYLGGFTRFILSDDVKIFLRRGGGVA